MRSLPNILTMSRIAVIPVLVILVWVGTDQLKWIALGVYTFACITDYFDGYIARLRNEITNFGIAITNFIPFLVAQEF